MSTNLSKIKRDKMLDTISKIKANINDEETIKNLSLIEYELTKKKYGLVWEEHEEKVDEELKTQIPTFEEINSREIVSNRNEKYNFLLEGDNLHSLYLLEKTHLNKIDVIFIDPPYNTGNNDFIYNDTMINNEDGFKHSKWISFMSRRLNIAKRLLADNGIIFISIDDNEQAQLKMLCDEIFGENNFMANIIWQSSIQPKGYNQKFSLQHNYILAYRKSEKFVLNSLPRTDEDNKAYSNPDNDPRGPWRSGDTRNALYRPNLIYDIIAPNGNIIKPCPNGWRWSKETVEEKIKTGEIIFSKEQDRIIRKIYLDTLDGRTPETIWFGKDVGTTRTAMQEIKDFFGSNVFQTPKPVTLIKKLLQLHTNKNATILDFFAGSGTTGQAVLELNKEDNGNRNYILCTNNENNICEEITYKRLYKINYGTAKIEPLKHNLKYYKTTYIPRLNTDEENIQENLLLNIKNLIQLENGISVDNEKIRVILDEEEIDRFSSNAEEVKKCEKLYISTDILLTAQQVKIFKDNNVEVFIIPEYYFENEIREVQ